MASTSGFRVNIFKRGEILVPKFVIANLGLGLDDTVALAVSSDLCRVLLARADMPDNIHPKNFMRLVYAKVKKRTDTSYTLYSAALLQIAGTDFEVGVYSKYRRVLDDEGKVCAIVFSRTDEDRKRNPGTQLAPNDHCLTPLLEECLTKVLANTRLEKPTEIPFLPFSTMRQQGYLDRNGCYTKKALDAAEAKALGGQPI